MQKQIRIILVDDHQAVRESWKFFLEKDGRFEVSAECANGKEAIEKSLALLPDVILMDINMQPMSGFEATRILCDKIPGVKIIGLSVNSHPGYANKLMELGASGFVTKSSAFSELVVAILKVLAGETYVCDEVRNSAAYQHKL